MGDSSASDGQQQQKQCTLLGGPFELLVQFFLALTAVAALVYKRHLERPPNRRSWLIWSLDCSKQAYASALQHATNMILGVLFGGTGKATECAWYLTNFTITVFCGVVLLSGAMSIYNGLVEKYDWTLLKTGEYGTPPSWKPWLAQSLVWGFLASGEKLITALLVILPLREPLDTMAAYLEAPLLNHPKVELVLVMVVGPMLLNTLFFWVVDGIIMRQGRRGGASNEDAPHEEIGEAVLVEKDGALCSDEDGKSGTAGDIALNGMSNQEYNFMDDDPSLMPSGSGKGSKPGLVNIV
mmetsp:Transcript_12458/g.26367  ORF Transcript_12458/g.26367 Transcript_12458/m.26367 type:complete len:296 (-) Transcript_12458:65-952(-)